MKIISKPVESAIEQEIQSLPSLKKAHSLLSQAPTTIVKVEALMKKHSTVEKIEAFAVLGYKSTAAHHVKSNAAAAVILPRGGESYGILYEGELRRPKINARWNKEQLLNQPMELFYNAEVVYGSETIGTNVKLSAV